MRVVQMPISLWGGKAASCSNEVIESLAARPYAEPGCSLGSNVPQRIDSKEASAEYEYPDYDNVSICSWVTEEGDGWGWEPAPAYTAAAVVNRNGQWHNAPTNPMWTPSTPDLYYGNTAFQRQVTGRSSATDLSDRFQRQISTSTDIADFEISKFRQTSQISEYPDFERQISTQMPAAQVCEPSGMAWHWDRQRSGCPEVQDGKSSQWSAQPIWSKGDARQNPRAKEFPDKFDDLALPSYGSYGHPYNCGFACKYVGRNKGCRDGRSCTSCHLCSWTRKTRHLQGRERMLAAMAQQKESHEELAAQMTGA